MWFLVLIFAVLLGYALSKRERIGFDSFIIFFIAALMLGWLLGLIAIALAPALTAFQLPAQAQMLTYVILDIVGLIAGIATGRIEAAIK